MESSVVDSKINSLKASLGETLMKFFISVLANLIAVAFLMYGLAMGLERVFQTRPWLGFILIGVSVLAFHRMRISTAKKPAQAIDVRKLTQEYPFYSAGFAMAAGFMLAGGIKKTAVEKITEKSPEKSSLVTMIIELVENFLKEAILPLIKEFLDSIKNKPSPHAEDQI